MLLDEEREICADGAGVVRDVLTTIVPAPRGNISERLMLLESVISGGLQAYIMVGEALEEIRVNRLYRELGYKTFENYCSERWHISARTAYQRIEAANVAARVNPCSQPPSFSQARELATLTPEQQLEVSNAILADRSFDKLPVSDVRQIARDVKAGVSPTNAVQRSFSPPESTDSAAAEEVIPELPPMPISRRGDCWILGEHRLVIGDAQEAGDGNLLIGTEQADLVITDPPYNVDYTGRTAEHLKIKNDNMTGPEYESFLGKVFKSLTLLVKPSVSLYLFHASCWQREVQNALEAVGFRIRTQLIWAKNHFGWGFARYKQQHENIFYCHLSGKKDDWYGDKTQTTLWEFGKPAANTLHPTMKPLELIEQAIINSSELNDIVLDLFGGSGSTLIACDRQGRKARVMELDPKYGDVIIERWQEETGLDAVLDDDGRTFEQVAEERSKVAP